MALQLIPDFHLKKNIYYISIGKVRNPPIFFCDIRFAFRKLRSSGSWHTGICVRVWFAWSCCSKFLNVEQLEKNAFLSFFSSRHSYTNLKIVNWGKVSITEPDVKKKNKPSIENKE